MEKIIYLSDKPRSKLSFWRRILCWRWKERDSLPLEELEQSSRASAEFVQSVHQEFSRLPALLTKALKRHEFALLPVLTIWDISTHLSFAGPRGRSGGKELWPTIGGICILERRLAVVTELIAYASEISRLNPRNHQWYKQEDYLDTMWHEVGHSLDSALAADGCGQRFVSAEPGFLKAWLEDCRTIAEEPEKNIHLSYFLHKDFGPEETFAQLFACWMQPKKGGFHNNLMRSSFKLSAAWLDKRLECYS